MMKYYELACLISSEVAEEEAKGLQDEIISAIQTEEGILNGNITLFKKRLAYPIKKQIQAHLSVLNFQLEPEKLIIIEKKIKENKKIIRHLIIVRIPGKERPLRTKRTPKIISKITSPSEKKAELKEIEAKLAEILD